MKDTIKIGNWTFNVYEKKKPTKDKTYLVVYREFGTGELSYDFDSYMPVYESWRGWNHREDSENILYWRDIPNLGKSISYKTRNELGYEVMDALSETMESMAGTGWGELHEKVFDEVYDIVYVSKSKTLPPKASKLIDKYANYPGSCKEKMDIFKNTLDAFINYKCQ